MNLIKNYLLRTLLVVAAVLSLHSCSCSGPKSMEGKLDKVSDKAQLIVTVNVEKLFEQLDITVSDKGTIELPTYFTQFFNAVGGNRKELRQITEFSGIDYTQAVIAGYDLDDSHDPFVMMIFNITDKDDFIKSVKEADDNAQTRDSDGYTVISTSDGYGPKLLIKDNLAYMVSDKVSAKDLSQRLEAAKDLPLAEWKKKYLSDDNSEVAVLLTGDILDNIPAPLLSSFTAGIDIDPMTASFGFKGTLSGPTASINGAYLDKDGNPAKLKFTKNIDTALLKYINPKDLAVSATGISSLEHLKTLIARMGIQGMPDEMQASLDKILSFKDLSLVFAAGPLTDKSFIEWNDPAAEIRLTVALSGSEADMKDLYNFVCEFMDLSTNEFTNGQTPRLGSPAKNYPDQYTVRVKTNERYNWETDEYEYNYMDIYAQRNGNSIVFSNAPVTDKGNTNFTAAEFGDKTAMFKIILPKDLPNLGGIKLPNGFVLTGWGGDTAAGNIELSITGTQEKIIPAIVDMAMTFGSGGM